MSASYVGYHLEGSYMFKFYNMNPAGVNLFKFNDENTRTICENCQ